MQELKRKEANLWTEQNSLYRTWAREKEKVLLHFPICVFQQKDVTLFSTFMVIQLQRSVKDTWTAVVQLPKGTAIYFHTGSGTEPVTLCTEY